MFFQLLIVFLDFSDNLFFYHFFHFNYFLYLYLNWLVNNYLFFNDFLNDNFFFYFFFNYFFYNNFLFYNYFFLNRNFKNFYLILFIIFIWGKMNFCRNLNNLDIFRIFLIVNSIYFSWWRTIFIHFNWNLQKLHLFTFFATRERVFETSLRGMKKVH